MRGKWTIGAALCLATALAGCATNNAGSDLSRSFFSDMMYLKDATSARVSSWDRSGGNKDFRGVQPGQTLELASLEGAGCIRHIYFTIGGARHYLRDLVLRMYWDGETDPSVEVPFGDFFGLGHEQVRFFKSLMVTVCEGGNGIFGTYGFNAYFPMPFADGARLTLTNEGPDVVGAVWYHVDYEKLASAPSGVGRFHAQWRRENTTKAATGKQGSTLRAGANLDGKENYVILEAEGHGNLAGYFLNVDNLAGGWYGEGDDMIFIDGEKWPPSFHGTGTEEIFGGGACPNVEYSGPYTGFHLVANPNFAGKTSMYRFFVNDPVRFKKSIKVSIEHGHANDLSNEYSSTVFWYQTEPHAPFPKLLPADKRHPLEGDDPASKAFQKMQEFRGLFYQALMLSRNSSVKLRPELQAKGYRASQVTLSEDYLRRDYGAVAETCDAMSGDLKAFLEANKPKSGE